MSPTDDNAPTATATTDGPGGTEGGVEGDSAVGGQDGDDVLHILPVPDTVRGATLFAAKSDGEEHDEAEEEEKEELGKDEAQGGGGEGGGGTVVGGGGGRQGQGARAMVKGKDQLLPGPGLIDRPEKHRQKRKQVADTDNEQHTLLSTATYPNSSLASANETKRDQTEELEARASQLRKSPEGGSARTDSRNDAEESSSSIGETDSVMISRIGKIQDSTAQAAKLVHDMVADHAGLEPGDPRRQTVEQVALLMAQVTHSVDAMAEQWDDLQQLRESRSKRKSEY